MRNLWLASLLLATLAFGCKQPEGGRCQVGADCEDGLECSASEPRVCLPVGSSDNIDAAPLPDSRFDARVADANTQPTPDAPAPDAPEVTIDAALPDAP